REPLETECALNAREPVHYTKFVATVASGVNRLRRTKEKPVIFAHSKGIPTTALAMPVRLGQEGPPNWKFRHSIFRQTPIWSSRFLSCASLAASALDHASTPEWSNALSCVTQLPTVGSLAVCAGSG